MNWRKGLAYLGPTVVVAGLLAAGALTFETWRGWVVPTEASADDTPGEAVHELHGPEGRVRLSPQARANLRLQVAPLKLATYWRTLPIPGAIVERPGTSNRGVTATLAGVVLAIAAVPGDIVKPGDELFTLRLVSESLQVAQAQLYRAGRELEINAEEQKRLRGDGMGAENLFRARLIELGYEERRLTAALETHRQDLIARGLTPEQVKQIGVAKFVTETTIRVPRHPQDEANPVYEVEELKVHLGEQVQAGQSLAMLAYHQALFIEGRALEQETPRIRLAAERGWEVEVEFLDDAPGQWPPFAQALRIRHVANHVDPASRTFSFFLALANQFHELPAVDGPARRLWRFRPGQRVRLHVPTEEFKNVFVVPGAAVVREGPEAYVFRANGDVLDRKPVVVLYDDGRRVVLANDGSVTEGNLIAQNAAAQLQRAAKAKAEGSGGHGHDHAGHSH